MLRVACTSTRITGRASLLTISLWARSIIRQGILSESRNSYWKFIATAALRYRKTFDTAMTLAVMGHHFQTLTRMVCEAD